MEFTFVSRKKTLLWYWLLQHWLKTLCVFPPQAANLAIWENVSNDFMLNTFCLTKLSRIIIHPQNLTKSLSGNLYSSNFRHRTRLRIKRADNLLSKLTRIEFLPECYQKTCFTSLFRPQTLMMHRKFFSIHQD